MLERGGICNEINRINSLLLQGKLSLLSSVLLSIYITKHWNANVYMIHLTEFFLPRKDKGTLSLIYLNTQRSIEYTKLLLREVSGTGSHAQWIAVWPKLPSMSQVAHEFTLQSHPMDRNHLLAILNLNKWRKGDTVGF